jgi:hypothetical protein
MNENASDSNALIFFRAFMPAPKSRPVWDAYMI